MLQDVTALIYLAGLLGHGHTIMEPLTDNNFMKIFCNFLVVIDEYFMMSHCQGNTVSGFNCTCLL